MKNSLFSLIKCCLAFLLAASNTLFPANNADSFNIDDVQNNEFIPYLGQLKFLDNNLNFLPSFYTKSSKQTILFYQDRFAFIFKNKKENSDSLEIIRIDMIFENANPNLKIVGSNKKNSYLNYYNLYDGNELTKTPTFNQIEYQNIYKDIDLIVYDNNGELEYDFILNPGANPSDIKLKLEGTEKYLIDEKGNLQIENQFSKLVKEKPVCFQIINNEKVPIKSQYSIENGQITFKIEDYISTDILVIDPIVRLLGSYYGGTNDDFGISIATDINDNIYILGRTNSTGAGVISTPGTHQLNLAGVWFWDLFVVKFSPDGERIWGTYYGGTEDEIEGNIVVDSEQNVFFCGGTKSTDGIATDGTYNGGDFDGFFVKLNSDGTRAFGKYYGGALYDRFVFMTLDQLNNIIIVGETNSTNNISTPTAHQINFSGGGIDGFIAKFDGIGNLLWGTYYGGSNYDALRGVDCDIDNNIYITGKTNSINNIATIGSFNGSFDSFLAKFNQDGLRQWGKYFGGSEYEECYGIKVFQNTYIYLAGGSSSDNGISTPGTYQELRAGLFDCYIAKFDVNGNIIWGTYYGGDYGENPIGSCLDNNGNIIIAGITNSSTGIATTGSFQTTIGSVYDGFIAKFNPEANIIAASYYGGGGDEQINSVAVKNNNDIVIVGYTQSINAIATQGAYQEEKSGLIDAFFAILTDNPLINILSINQLSICEGETCDIIFEVTNGSFQSNNTFTAQLSDENGNFENPINIGTTNGTGSGVIIAQIPLGTISGNNYLIRLVSSNPVVISQPYSQSITINSLPLKFNVTGGGAFCEGASGVSVGLEDSELGINYELFRDGNSVTNLAGTGNALDFGLQTQAGTYTVTAENLTTLCTSTMLGSAIITINPVPTQFNVTGGGAFCEGESGVSVGLDGSEIGVNYELQRDGNLVSSQAGTGNPLDFGLQIQAGTYTVTAENLTTLCTSNMLGSAVITIEPVPTQFNVTGGGEFCEGASGIAVGLDGSELGINYELLRDGISVTILAGTGNALDFGLQTQAGTYTVTAENTTTLCTSNMLGSAVITIEPVPTQFNVTGGGSYCEGESGVSVGLEDSEIGINYELLRDGVSVLTQVGTGNALDFGLQTQAGTYTVTAENTTTLCTSNMLGSAVITIEPVPTQFNVTGGGAFCEGASGIAVGLDGSELGINYELLRDGISVTILAGTVNALDFSLQTQAGTYTVTAENLTTLCTSTMLGSAVITIEPVPTQFNVTGGGAFCEGESGVPVGLEDSELGINYELFRDGNSVTNLAGTGNALDFGLQTQAGTYTVTAENTTTLCTSNMLGSAVITIEPVPTQFNVTGGGSYCEGESGVSVGLEDSEIGINYELLRDGVSVLTQVGTGNALDFGLQTQAGTYTVTAENLTTLCTSQMLGSAVITIEPVPTQFNVTGGGSYCEGESGVSVGLDGSEIGTNYELLRDGISVLTQAGTGNPLDFSLQTQAGTYTVTAENTTSLCTSNMLGSAVITIEPVPTQFNVSGGGAFCEGESGVSVGLDDSEIGINYELLRDEVSVLTQVGTGNALDFGLQTQAGTYTVIAENTTTLCTSNMLGSAVITIEPVPTQFNVTGGGAFCEGESGVAVGLSGSEIGINYELLRDGNSVTNLAGTGNALDFGLQTQAGTYTVTAENTTTLCTSNMLGSAVITIEPVPTQYIVTGGGAFCEGESGVVVGLDGSELGINYELLRDGNLVTNLAGTGNALDFGLQTQAGTYTVTAENLTTLCTSNMLGSAVITIEPVPTQFNVTGGGSYCEGESGVSVGLEDSEIGINYELLRDGVSVLTQVGTGNALDFGLQTQAGTYTVTAENLTTLCTSQMLGSAVITIEPVPTQFNVSGGGSYCEGESGVSVGLDGSEIGTNYELLRDGNSVLTQAGTGNALDFGLQTQAGTYTVTAENTTSLCTSNMLGSAVITIEPVPTQFNVTGGGAFCEGESGIAVGLDGSELGINYELLRDGISITNLAGTGNALDFGLQTQAGTYTITAENLTTLCTSTMLGSAVITIEPVPTQFNVTGGGAFCEGESGVSVGLDDSENGINYELLRDGNSVSSQVGTGNALDFGLQIQAGTYTVTAENTTTLCTSNMLGSAVITIEPVPTQFNVTGGGVYCEGESGVSVGLDDSELGVNYELQRDGNLVSSQAGTGNALDFGLQTQAGTYTITAENLTTLCTSNMLGSAVITIEPVPTQFNVTGGGAFCEGESGIAVGLDGSELGINYELLRDGISVTILAGTGNALDFGLQIQAGTYTVTAENSTTLCTSNMLGNAVITIEPVPTQFNVTGGGAFCEGASGISVGLDDSELGINYELFRDGNLVITLAGTGNPLDFGLQTQAGTYTVTAENTTTLCTSNMFGSAIITIEPVPTQFNVTGGGVFCEGASGVSIGLDDSEIGIDYELFRDGNSVLILAGTGNALDFGLQTQAGTYTITAENATTLCTSNMLGSAFITIEPVPTQFNVTGGGEFCEGASGIAVGLDGSELGINYELLRDGNSVLTLAGTGNALDFGLQTQAGTYTVTAENTTTLCTSNMLGSAVITIEPVPTQFNVTGGGAFCEGESGVAVGLSGSEIGINYELLRDGNSVSSQAGTGNALDFGLQTQAGMYTVTAENLTTLCTSNMLGSAVITIEPVPTQFNVTGGDVFCEGESGVSVGLSDSELGINYELLRDGNSVTNLAGTGNALDFGLQTQAGTYTITAENLTTLCTSNMLGSAVITIEPVPTQFNVTGGGAFCEGESGIAVGLDGSELGINYELLRDGISVTILAGTGNALDFGLQIQAGTYTVTAENSTTLCTSNMLGNAVITIEPVPTQFNVTGGGAFCEGASGISVGLDDSELGINYELFRDGNLVITLAGTGNPLDFGLQTQAGTYTVTAENTTTLCTSNMFGSAIITIEPVPTQFNVTGGGAFCEGESGASVGLDGSEIGVDYELFRNGNSVLTQAGTGNSLDFGLQSQAGTYTVTAENLTTLCTSNMLGNAVITIEPVPTQFNLTGGGSYCEGESGVSVGLSDSEIGINYELLRDGNSVLTLAGTGNALDFGLQTQAGMYTVAAENLTTLCTSNMLGNAVITIEPVPTQFNLTGGGSYCEGESGVPIGLSDSEIGINYELFRDGNLVSSQAGTGNALDFGLQTQAGTYTVAAENTTTLCSSNMLGSAVITISPLPNAIITGETSVIVGDEDSYLAENADNSVCYWFVTNGEIIGSSNANPVTIIWTNVGTGSIKLILENTYLCKDSTEITVQIAPNFEYSIQGDNSVCLNSESNYAISGENGFEAQWSVQNAVIIGNSNEKNVLINFSQTGIATIFAKITKSGTGQVFNIEKSVTVLELPEVNLDEFSDICLNEPEFVLTGGTPLGGDYSGIGVSNGIFYPSIAGVGEDTITYTYTNEFGCSNSVSATIKVNPLPEKPVLSFDGEKLTTSQAESYIWYLDSNEIETSNENFYYPQKDGNFSVTVIDSNGCQSELSDFLQVNIPKPVADIKISIAIDSASVGDTIKIPIFLEKATNLDTAGITDFTATIHLNSTMLKPIGKTPGGSIVGNIRTIQIEGTVSENSEFLYEMEFVVTLGNSECTQIIIDEINFIGGDYRLEKQDGVFCVKDLCKQSGTRLFAGTYPIYLSECVPNPAADEFSISFNLIEEAQTTLTIYNLFGTKVQTIFDKVATAGTFSIKQNISDLTNGVYIIVLKTPSHNLARMLRVVK